MKLERIAYALVIVIALAVILVQTKNVLIPFVLAVMIWIMIRQLQKAAAWIRVGGKPLPSWISGTMAFAAIFLALGLMVSLLTTNIKGINEVLPKYQGNLLALNESLRSELGLDLQGQLDHFSEGFDVATLLTGLFNSLTVIFGNAFLVVIYVAFLMLEERHIRPKLMVIVPEQQKRERNLDLLREVDRSLSRYVTLKTAISLFTGALSYVALIIIGVDFAFFWAFVIFALNYIPTIGSMIATTFPALIAALQFGGSEQALWVLGAVGAIQVLVGNVLEPRLMGNTLNVSPLVVLLSLAFWGSLWGVVGMVLAVPITVMLVIGLAQFPTTRWVAVLLSEKGVVGNGST